MVCHFRGTFHHPSAPSRFSDFDIDDTISEFRERDDILKSLPSPARSCLSFVNVRVYIVYSAIKR